MPKAKAKLVFFGGFLGSGKTTLMVALGKRMLASGKSVALITNDQGEFLVDTEFARSEGFSTTEVLKGCFCCRFPDFMEGVSTAMEQADPDYILAEPVGSCTDLLATIVTPLMTYHKESVRLAPLFVLVDGMRTVGEYVEMNLKAPGAPKEVLVSHQIREAQIILLSKTDAVDGRQLGRGRELVLGINPDAEIIEFSSKTGEGLDEILSRILNEDAEFKKAVPLDYDVYAQAEAEYGWYNGTWKVTSPHGFNPFDLCMRLIRSFSDESFPNEVAHAKLHLISEACSFKLSLVNGIILPDGVCAVALNAESAVMTLNVRARAAPQDILSHTESILQDISEDLEVTVRGAKHSAFVPSRPEPYHRMS